MTSDYINIKQLPAVSDDKAGFQVIGIIHIHIHIRYLHINANLITYRDNKCYIIMTISNEMFRLLIVTNIFYSYF